MLSPELLAQLWRAHRAQLIALGVLLLANVVLYLWLSQSLAPTVSAVEDRYIKRQAEVRQILRNKGDLANSPEQRFVLASQDISEFREEIPEYQEFTELIEELLVLSNRAGLNITQVNYKPKTVEETRLLRYNFSFSVNGTYKQVKQFVHLLEQSRRLLVITQIGWQGTEGGNVGLRLNMETYFRPAEEGRS